MNKLHILTPVKDSLETTVQTIESIMGSDFNIDFSYTVYNDFSSDSTTEMLEKMSEKLGFTLINLKNITLHPSPNYLLILQMAQQRAIFENAHLMIIESDIIVEKKTIQQMYDAVNRLEKPGMLSVITKDSNNKINYPHFYSRRYKSEVVNTKKKLSFSCSLLSQSFLASYNFDILNPERTWHDFFISKKSIELGFNNYLLTSLPVTHLENSLYPWKHLKNTEPIKYYWNKFIATFIDK